MYFITVYNSIADTTADNTGAISHNQSVVVDFLHRWSNLLIN